jgi:hypothetical protein
MDAASLVLLLAGFTVVLLGALASIAGVDSRDGFGDHAGDRIWRGPSAGL